MMNVASDNWSASGLEMSATKYHALILDLDERSSHLLKCWAVSDELARYHGKESILLSNKANLGIALQAGLKCEYFPGLSSNGFDLELWNKWLELRVFEICIQFSVDKIIYIGSAPPSGLLRALNGFPQIQTFWIHSGGTGINPAQSDLAIHFNFAFEESTVPVAVVERSRQGLFEPIPVIFRRTETVEIQKPAMPNSKPSILLCLGLEYRRWTLAAMQMAESLLDCDQELKVSFSDCNELICLAWEGPYGFNQIPSGSMAPDVDVLITDNPDTAGFWELVDACVPVILLKGRSSRSTKTFDYLTRNKFAVEVDPAAARDIAPGSLRKRLERLRKRNRDDALCNGTEIVGRRLMQTSPLG